MTASNRGEPHIGNPWLQIPLDDYECHMALPEVARIDRAGSLTEFAAAIQENREPECSGRDNLSTLAFMLAAVESSETGQTREVAVGQPVDIR